MKKLEFKGNVIELNVCLASYDELESIKDGDYDSDYIRDEMGGNIFTQYNIELTSGGVFIDDNNNIIKLKHLPIYCSNIGEPLLSLNEIDTLGIIEAISELYGDDFDSVYDKISNNGQFENMKCIDNDLLEIFRRAISVNVDGSDIENLVSVKNIENGIFDIIIPEGFDINLPMCIGTHEIEFTGEQIGTVIMQYNNGKILASQLEIELDSSTTESSSIYVMTELEVDDDGRIMSDEFDEI